MPYKVHSVTIDVDALGVGDAVDIPDIISESLTNNPMMDAIITAGETMPTHVSLLSQKITGSFDTYALDTVMDTCGLQPMCIAVTPGNEARSGVVFNMQQFESCGGATGGSTDRTLAISCGAIVPRRLTAEHQGYASMGVDVVVAKDSTNNAIVISDAGAVPTLEGGGDRWTVGQMKVGNIALTDYTSLEIDFGNTVTTRGSQSDIWDAYVEVSTHAPTITIRGITPAWFKESGGIPIAGLACTHANTVLYLRKRDPGGAGFVADNTAEHIKFTAKGVASIETAMTGQAHQFTETSLVIRCMYDGTDDPIEVDTTSAIA